MYMYTHISLSLHICVYYIYIYIQFIVFLYIHTHTNTCINEVSTTSKEIIAGRDDAGVGGNDRRKSKEQLNTKSKEHNK